MSGTYIAWKGPGALEGMGEKMSVCNMLTDLNTNTDD